MNVNNLTALARTSLSFALTALSMIFVIHAANANGAEELGSIRATAEAFALEQVRNEKLTNISATAINLDARLQLKKCDQALEAFPTTSTANVSRMTVGVRCTGSSPWTLYVPVTISAMANVVYTLRPLQRGELLQEVDVEIRQVPLNRLPANYLSEPQQLAGMELNRAVTSGAILTMNILKARQLIQQGQEVVIVANGTSVQVRMNGTAMQSGSLGDLISIRNTESGRTIEAKVLSNGIVGVTM